MILISSLPQNNVKTPKNCSNILADINEQASGDADQACWFD